MMIPTEDASADKQMIETLDAKKRHLNAIARALSLVNCVSIHHSKLLKVQSSILCFVLSGHFTRVLVSELKLNFLKEASGLQLEDLVLPLSLIDTISGNRTVCQLSVLLDLTE